MQLSYDACCRGMLMNAMRRNELNRKVCGWFAAELPRRGVCLWDWHHGGENYCDNLLWKSCMVFCFAEGAALLKPQERI